MARGKAERLRKEDREARQRAGDLAEAGRVGEEFGLGTVELAWRYRGLTFLGFLRFLVFFGGWTAGFTYVVFQGVPPAGRWAAGALIFFIVFLVWAGAGLESAGDRLFLYSGGVARLVSHEPEPRVLRWADIETVTITTDKDDDGDPRTSLDKCVLRGRPETEISIDGGVVRAAHAALAPRLVPPLIAAYESGEPVAAAEGSGLGQVEPQGIRLRNGERFAWTEISSMTMQHDPKGTPDVVTRIDIRAGRKNQLHYFDLSGIPNGIFPAHLVAHAATRNGVQVDGHEQPDDDLPGPCSLGA